MDDKFTKKELKSLQNSFTLFDKDHDGKLTIKEVDGALRFLGKDPTRYRVESVMKDIDTYGNGTVAFPEFLQLMSQTNEDGEFDQDETFVVFRRFDKDGDGFITANEIKEEMLNHGNIFTEDQVRQMISRADANGDGKIDYEEFVQLIKSKL